MKKIFRSPLLFLILTLFLLLLGRVVINAKQESSYLLSDIALELYTEHQHSTGTSQNDNSQEAEFLSMAAANEDFNLILTYVHDYPESELAQHYGGAYINENKILVIRLTCQDSNCICFLKENILHAPVKYEHCEKPFLTTESTYYEIAEKLSELNAKYISQDAMNDEELYLAKAYPALSFNEDTNTLAVRFSKESNTEMVSEEEYLTLCRHWFEAVIGQYDITDYELISQSELLFSIYSTSASPGQGLTVKKLVNGSWVNVGICSLGYRVHYTGSSGTINGFVTCGHGMANGYRVYLHTTSGLSLLGNVYAVKNTGPVDASVIQIETNITSSQTVYYSNSTGQLGGVALDGTGITPAVGSTLYKAGCATFLTSGYLYNIYGNGYFAFTPDETPVYHFDLLKVSGSIANQGDSGGIAYVNNPSTSFSKAAGIVLGGDSSWTFFIKYSSIANNFGPTTY